MRARIRDRRRRTFRPDHSETELHHRHDPDRAPPAPGRIVNLSGNFFPALGVVAAFSHGSRAIADIAALKFAVHHPALHREIEFLFPDLDNVRNPVAPFLSGHPARVSVFTELPVRVGTDQAVFDFHGSLPFFSVERLRGSTSYHFFYAAADSGISTIAVASALRYARSIARLSCAARITNWAVASSVIWRS